MFTDYSESPNMLLLSIFIHWINESLKYLNCMRTSRDLMYVFVCFLSTVNLTTYYFSAFDYWSLSGYVDHVT